MRPRWRRNEKSGARETSYASGTNDATKQRTGLQVEQGQTTVGSRWDEKTAKKNHRGLIALSD